MLPSLTWMLELNPRLTSLTVVGDGSKTHAAIEKKVREDLLQFPMIQEHFVAEKRLDLILKQLDTPPDDLERFVLLTTVGGLTDADGNVLASAGSLRALSEGPWHVIGMEDGQVREGVLGAKA